MNVSHVTTQQYPESYSVTINVLIVTEQQQPARYSVTIKVLDVTLQRHHVFRSKKITPSMT